MRMFTGLVLGQGEVVAIQKQEGQARLTLQPAFAFHTSQVGESVAINGVCLTLDSWNGNQLSFYASAESLAVSNLALLKNGSMVNMERALAIGDRLGGHFVSGHVDTLASVEFVQSRGESRHCRLIFAPTWSEQITPKGSICLDGISLTINDCGPGWLEVNIIPETWRVTTVAAWWPGSKVNMEIDILCKYVHQLIKARMPSFSVAPASTITLDFLRENGF